MPMMSPRTQGLAAQSNSGDQAKMLFEKGFSDMAYNVLINKLPNISPDVVTFKILDSDAEIGAGVGAFVLSRNSQVLYIPVVLAENQIKPIEIMYYKKMNVFMPLTKEWLQEVDKLALGEMGKSVAPPTTLSTDVDIRNTVVPPTTGRYSYASDQTLGVRTVFEEARHHDGAPTKLAFMQFLETAPNRVKKAMARLFETNHTLLKQAASFYGTQNVINALAVRTEKVADYGANLSRTGALYVADKKTKSSDFKSIFGPDAGLAFTGVSLKGYFAKDDRKNLNRAMKVEHFQRLQEPKEPGVYRLWRADGKPVLALIFDNPIALGGHVSDRKQGIGRKVPAKNIRFRPTNAAPAIPSQGGGQTYRTPGGDGTTYSGDEFRLVYTGITEDGELIEARKRLVGEPVAFGELEDTKLFKKIVSDTKAGPRKGQKGIFVQRRGASFVATEPVRIENVSEMSNGETQLEIDCCYDRKTVIIDKDSPTSRLMVPSTGNVIHMPANFTFLAAKEPAQTDDEKKYKLRSYIKSLDEDDFLSTPEMVRKWAEQETVKVGGERVVVRRSAHGYTFGAGGTKEAFDFIGALRKLAVDCHIGVDDAAHALKMADDQTRYEFWVISDAQWNKLAAEDGAPPGGGGAAPPGQDPNAPQDPAGAAMAGMGGAPMAPAAPNPIDMAVAEAMQNLMMQQQGLQSQMTLLQTIQQRTNQIAGGGGAMGSPAAAAAAMGGPMDPSMMGGGAAPMQPGPGGAPPAGGMPQMPQQAGMAPPGGMPQQGGMAPPGGMPQQGGPMAMQQGGGPQAAMGGGMQPGMDAMQQQQQGPAMMAADDGSVDSIMAQVNPQFMQQAGQLNDAGVFDAAALASMAQTPALKDLVGAYVPNLEKSLDNLGRVLLSLWMDESKIKQDIGTEAYISLEDNLRTVFKGLGDLILKVNQNTSVMRGPNETSFAEM